jgi:putative holliday junction resolvase
MMTAFPTSGRIAAIDYGTARTGIAICDPDRIVVSPLIVIPTQQADGMLAALETLIAQEKIVAWVVGFPLHTRGGSNPSSVRSRNFARWLGNRTHLPVRLFDERFTTHHATQRLAAMGLTRKKKKQRIDAVAALVILEAFIESWRGRGDLPGLDPSEPLPNDASQSLEDTPQ